MGGANFVSPGVGTGRQGKRGGHESAAQSGAPCVFSVSAERRKHCARSVRPCPPPAVRTASRGTPRLLPWLRNNANWHEQNCIDTIIPPVFQPEGPPSHNCVRQAITPNPHCGFSYLSLSLSLSLCVCVCVWLTLCAYWYWPPGYPHGVCVVVWTHRTQYPTSQHGTGNLDSSVGLLRSGEEHSACKALHCALCFLRQTERRLGPLCRF